MPSDVAAALPQLDLTDGTVITVTLDDPLAKITSLTIHGWQDVPGVEPDAPLPLLTVEALDAP